MMMVLLELDQMLQFLRVLAVDLWELDLVNALKSGIFVATCVVINCLLHYLLNTLSLILVLIIIVVKKEVLAELVRP